MAKFSCTNCGMAYSKWIGKCAGCGEWNTIAEDAGQAIPMQFSRVKNTDVKEIEFFNLKGEIQTEDRIISSSNELNRVLGGGIIKGSGILIGGEPGVGKSTLLLDLAGKLATNNLQVVYVSGEESVNQIRLRAKRMGLEDGHVKLITTTNLSVILSIVKLLSEGDVLIIDSIQTVFAEEIGGTPGSVAQVKACTHEILVACKQRGVSVFFVGHINKEGQIAGPKILEHMVDVVLYFEEDTSHNFRILRNIKNRFGSVQESGIFRMVKHGLEEISNPSELFLSKKSTDKIGSVVFAGIEGTRPVLIEIETLLSPSFMSFPRRAVVGWDANRLAITIAILSTHLKLKLHEKEVYLNIAGGVKTSDVSIDLAVILCLFSSFFEVPLKKSIAAFGEVGLSGEVRPVQFMEARIREAIKLGYTTLFCPKLSANLAQELGVKEGVKIHQISDVKEVARLIST